MLVVVKKPHIEISADSIPEELLRFLSDHYDKVDVFEDEDATVDISETAWYARMKGKRTPGERMKRYRKRAGLTQSQLAEKLGLVKQNVSAMEKGARGISKAIAHKLAEIFNVSAGRFI